MNFLISESKMKNNEIIQKIIDRLKQKPGLILLHHNADIDAVVSAIAFQSAFPEYRIGVFQKVSNLSKGLLNYFPEIEILHSPELERFKTIVILDTSSPTLLGMSDDLPIDVIVLDHHMKNDLWGTKLYYCDESKTSCAEIIFELLEFIDFQIEPKTAIALLVGILADTGHFKYATSQSFVNFGRLLELSKTSMGNILKILENTNTPDISRRIAHLKGAQRLIFRQVNKYLVAVSQLSSFEASMCRQLMILGADVGFVGAQRNKQLQISGRISTELVDAGVHLGKLFQSMGVELTCEGGGHPGAAGMNGIGDVEMALNVCVKKITKILERL